MITAARWELSSCEVTNQKNTTLNTVCLSNDRNDPDQLPLNVLLGGLVEGHGLLRSIDVRQEVEAEADLGDQVNDGDDADLLG
mmetsp:Transcript_53295/g.111206  ORF Transcript_53295/g.111206 Transcript_53295/m.111206 type:complete len:83 (-) Transcript_53295:639-887(-)